MALDKINERLIKIEMNQEKFTDAMNKIAPIVEEYHASKIMQKKWSERLKFISLVIGTLTVLVACVDNYLKKLIN